MFYRILFFIIVFFVFPVSAQAKILLILGDSLSAAYGMPVEEGWVSLLEQRIIRHDLDYKVVNASISGETTLGAKTRLKKLLKDNQPELAIIALGGNDGLRGFALTEIEQNLVDIVKTIKQSDSGVLLVPMQLPPNYGAAYNRRFISIYNAVSDTMEVDMSEFILNNIAQHPELMQADGIHPVQAAQSIMLDNIWPTLQALIIK
jgi:acyl-CoA thioesterase I